MKRELGIARCRLACCICSANESCAGCSSGKCQEKEWCENRRCSIEKGLEGCYACADFEKEGSRCQKEILKKNKPYGLALFAHRNGAEELLRCLERNEQNGVVYHREGLCGDYDDFDDVEKLMLFIMSGKKEPV